jgi:hypothetical protein
MARRNDADAAGCGCLGFGLLLLIGLCTGGGSGGSSRDTYVPTYSPTPTASTSTYTTDNQRGEWFYIHGTLNVRSEPSKDARIVRTLGRGDRVQLGPKDARGWARLYGYVDGYVYRASDLVQTRAPSAPQRAVSSRSSYSGGSRRRSGGGRQLHVGPRGGCYYINSNGNKTYVDRSECH